jgi:ribosome modulation factor
MTATANDLNVARASGVLAATAGDSRDSCLWESGPMRDAWLAGYDAHAMPLNKVLPSGGPLIPGHPDYPMPYTECQNCRARTPSGVPTAHFKNCAPGTAS